MGTKMTIKQAAACEEIGLTEYAIRQGIRQGRYPNIRTNGTNGKILIDKELMLEYLEKEARRNATNTQDKTEAINYGRLRKILE